MIKANAKIKALLMDVDGVLTDGGMYYSESGDEWKKFDTRDGNGISILQKNGYKVGIITKEKTKIVLRRSNKLKIKDLYQGAEDKVKALRHFMKKYGFSSGEISYIGDDLVDLEIMKAVGLPIAVNDAVAEIRKIAKFVTSKNGGKGAVREVCDLLIKMK